MILRGLAGRNRSRYRTAWSSASGESGIGCGAKRDRLRGARSIVCDDQACGAWPEATGLKTREMAQLVVGASGAVQLLVRLNSEALDPLRDTEET